MNKEAECWFDLPGYVPDNFTGIARYKYSGVEKEYFKCGQAHREDGPALYLHSRNSESFYYLNNIFYSKGDWFNLLTPEQKIIALMNPENFGDIK